MKRILWALPVVVIVVALFMFGFGRDPNAVPSELIHRPAPTFSLARIDPGYGALNLSRLRGRPVVLNFWASWCVACHDEHAYLVRAYHRWGRRVAFVGIVFEDSSSSAQAYLRQYGGGWPNLADSDGKVAINYGVSGVPETFFINRDGVIVAKRVGPVTPAILSQRIDQLLRERGA